MSRYKQHLVWKLNRATMGWNSARMSVKLGVHTLQQFFVIETIKFRRRLTPKRYVGAAVIATLVLTPTAMYLVERTNRLDSERAYRALAMESGAETEFLRASLRDLLRDQNRITSLLLDSGFTVRTGNEVTVKVVATGYSSTVWQTDATPNLTAANTRTREGVLALSRDLLKRYTPGAPFDFGDRVHISGLGYFVIEDSMNRRWDNRADIWFPSVVDARSFGRRDVYLTRVGAIETGGASATSGAGTGDAVDETPAGAVAVSGL